MIVLNKIDLLPDAQAASAALGNMPDAIAISALTGYGLDTLKEQIEEVLEAEMAVVDLLIPFERGDLVSLFHEHGLIEREEHSASGTRIVGRLPAERLPEFEGFQFRRTKSHPTES
jgi:GTP-binding protein HflX